MNVGGCVFKNPYVPREWILKVLWSVKKKCLDAVKYVFSLREIRVIDIDGIKLDLLSLQ